MNNIYPKKKKNQIGVQGFSGNEGLPGSKGSKGDPGLAGPRGPKGKCQLRNFTIWWKKQPIKNFSSIYIYFVINFILSWSIFKYYQFLQW